jgi:hypothetical protein
MVHRREVDGKPLVFGNQGALWGNAMTWWDHDTGSVWSQPLGEAIAGPLKGATLELLPSTLTTYGSWKAEHPGGFALDAPGGRSGFDLDQMAIVVDFSDESAAYSIPGLRDGGPINDEVAGVPVVVLTDPDDPDQWAVFSRRLDERTLTFTLDGGRFIDVETGTSWDAVRGIALEGALKGEVLDLLPGFTSFPSDYFTFWPEGRLWTGE